jgi:hypothetical protein
MMGPSVARHHSASMCTDSLERADFVRPVNEQPGYILLLARSLRHWSGLPPKHASRALRSTHRLANRRAKAAHFSPLSCSSPKRTDMSDLRVLLRSWDHLLFY